MIVCTSFPGLQSGYANSAKGADSASRLAIDGKIAMLVDDGDDVGEGDDGGHDGDDGDDRP